MKESLQLTWRQERKHRLYLKKAGIHYPHERLQRQCVKEVTQDWVHVDIKEFEGDNYQKVKTPFAYIKEIGSFVCNLLSVYSKKKLLNWHNNTIPDDQVWVKIGGDHGQGSLKITMQIANLAKPNSRFNTFLLAMARVKDTHSNIELMLRELKPKIDELKEIQWEGKKIVLFFFGDYDFLTKVYGLSGAQGKYPCLWCLQTKRDLKSFVEQASVPARNLSMLKEDYIRFMTDGKGDKKVVSMYNNSLHSPIMDMDINFVAPPYLHILLGIVYKHHVLLENAADGIDKQIIWHLKDEQTTIITNLKSFGRHWQSAETVQLRIDKLHNDILECTNEVDKIKFNVKMVSAKADLSKLKFEHLCDRSGPLCAILKSVLEKHKIQRQPFYGGTFLGNHCHKYLTCKIYKHLTNALVEQARTCTDDNEIIQGAYNIKEIFNSINEAYEQVHNSISHSKPIHTNCVPNIEAEINKYMSLFRHCFPNKTIPKQHILEHHCTDWIRKHGFGLGMHGEQGGEFVHSAVCKIEKRAWGIRNKVDELQFIMESHLVQTHPNINDQVSGVSDA
jgi:hypothetical protein